VDKIPRGERIEHSALLDRLHDSRGAAENAEFEHNSAAPRLRVKPNIVQNQTGWPVDTLSLSTAGHDSGDLFS
jgi:hypothetical protein